MKSKLGSWYERIAQLFEQENMDEPAEREWFAGITVHPGYLDRFIQYAHATLQLHNLYVSKNIKENLKQVSPANARDVITCLKRVRFVIKAAVNNHGFNEAAGYILHWADELEKAILDRDDLFRGMHERNSEEISFDKVMADLDKLISLHKVKRKIHDIASWTAFTRLRKEQGFKTPEIPAQAKQRLPGLSPKSLKLSESCRKAIWSKWED